VHHTVSTNIAFYFLECGHIQALLGKNRFPGSREFPESIFVPAFPGMAKKLSRGSNTYECINLDSLKLGNISSPKSRATQ
jgi:hypothetical protein